MNFLVQCSHRNHQVYFELCKILYKKYPGSKFGYLSDVENTKKLFQQSKSPEFHIFDINEMIENEKKSSIDMKLITDFETFSKIPIWKMLVADRNIGWNDEKGPYGTYIRRKFRKDKNFILKEFTNEIRKFSRIFNTFKPDIFFPAVAMGTISVFILESLCKGSGTKYLLPDYTRMKNLYRLSENVLCLSPEIDEAFYELMQSQDIHQLAQGRSLYQETQDNLSDQDSFDREHIKSYGFIESASVLDKFGLFKDYIFDLIRCFYIYLKKILKSLTQRNLNIAEPIYLFLISVKNSRLRLHNKLTVLDSSFGKLPEQDQKYLYFPLYNMPEYSSNFQSTLWLNIHAIVEFISMSIPADWVILLKEHPTTLQHNFRPKNFYKKLENIPNVMFAPLNADTHSLISAAELVFVTVGTSGWEAILRGKPIISLVENFWDCLGWSYVCSDFSNLNKTIQLAVKENKSITDEEREHKLICYLEALSRNSFEISDPEVFDYYYQGQEEQYSKQGKELAKGVIDYLEKACIQDNLNKKSYFNF